MLVAGMGDLNTVDRRLLEGYALKGYAQNRDLGKLMFGKVWGSLGKFGEVVGEVWESLGKLGKAWESFGKFGKVWICLDLFGFGAYPFSAYPCAFVDARSSCDRPRQSAYGTLASGNLQLHCYRDRRSRFGTEI